MGYRACSLLLLPGLLVGCGPIDGPGDGGGTPDGAFVLEGSYNADMNWLTRDGAPIFSESYGAFRFDKSGNTYLCYFFGRPAQSCELDAETGTFSMDLTYVTNYSSYVRTRSINLSATGLVEGDQLFAEFTDDYIYVYDNGDTYTRDYTGTADLRRVERLDKSESQGLSLIGEHGDFRSSAAKGAITHEDEEGGKSLAHGVDGYATANVRVKGDYAFVARFDDGLRVVDISNPSDIKNVGHGSTGASGGGYFNDVKLFEAGGRDYAAMSDSSVGLAIYDVTNPAAPTWVANALPEDADPSKRFNNHTSYIVGTTAYLGNYPGESLDPIEGSGGLLMVDLSDPSNPLELGRWLARDVGGSFVHDLFVRDGIAYLCTWEAGLVVLDVKDPADPKVLGQFTYDRMTSHSVWVTEIDGQLVAVHGDEDFGSHIRMVDVDPESPTFMAEVGDFQTRPQVSVHNVMTHGNYAIAAWYQDGVRVLDIADPTDPKMVGWFNSWKGYPDPSYGFGFFEGGIGVDVVGDTLYLADIQRGLLILDIDL